jgi:CubicO group peptidase (beta-lactamase class C family)
MANPKRHHFLPEFYLNGFSRDNLVWLQPMRATRKVELTAARGPAPCVTSEWPGSGPCVERIPIRIMKISPRLISRKFAIPLLMAATGWLLALGGTALQARESAANGLPTVHASVQLPATGPVVPELAALDLAMTSYMNTKGFEAGTIALMKDSKLVFRQGYGWRDVNKTAVTHPDNLFRLASVSKTITGCAITKLVADGKLSKSTKIYAYLGIQPWGGVLGDARINDITVQELLDHTGGWDSAISPVGDPIGKTVIISNNMGLDHPATAREVIAWMFSKPLDFTPGARSAYSNFGYSLLGRVVEKASGKTYLEYLQQDLFGPVGITNIIQSRSRPGDLDPWEIWYADSAVARSAVDFPTNISVRVVDGGLYYESFDSYGGLSASAGALSSYMLNYWVGGARRVPTAPYRWIYTFYGSLPGTTTVIHQDISQNGTSSAGLEFTVLFNERTNSNTTDNDEAHTAIVNAAAAIVSWPAAGGGAIQWSADATEVSSQAGSVTVQLTRTGSNTLPVKVSYATYDKTAGAADYTPSSGTVAFAAGETGKSISIPLLANPPGAAAKEFFVELISASGGAWFDSRVSTTVRILSAVVISLQPQSQVVAAGATATFTATASGNPSPTFQWQESANGGSTWTNVNNGGVYSGATTGTLSITGATAGMMGYQYRCVATNVAGAANSNAATLTVASGSYLANLSVRAAMAVGQTLIVGFVVDGGAKPILVRAAGPVLNQYGLTGVVDPQLKLFTGGGTQVAANDNWDAALASTFTTLGAFPFDANSKDAALLQTINGPHSAQATATGAGTLLVEAYDAGPNDGRKLVNLSTRFQVGTGDNILIAGFVLSGTGTRQLLIRAVGPTLTNYGVTGVLADPQLSVFDGGTPIASNNDWSSPLSATFTTLGAFALNAGSKDAALVVTLQAGKAYSVQVSGVGNTTGEALVEIYLMP